jgi:hypothetical protein
MNTQLCEVVKFKYPYSDEEFICDSLENAIQSLNELGFCMNWGILSHVQNVTVLNYQAITYRNTPERCVKLPFDVNNPYFCENLEGLLRDIFLPYIDSNSGITRSMISVQLQKDPFTNDQLCYSVNLLLVFKERDIITWEKVDKVLGSKAESSSEGKVKFYGFD